MYHLILTPKKRHRWARACAISNKWWCHVLVTPGRQCEHAQHVSSLKIYFRSRLTTVASRILKVPNLSSKALRCHISLKTYDLKFTLLWERASMRWLLMRALEKQLQDFTEMITIRSFIFLTIYVPILRVWMGEDKGQLSVKILAICQLLVKFKAICHLSVKWLLMINYKTYLCILDAKLRHI